MDNGVETVKVVFTKISKVAANFRHWGERLPEIATGKQIGIQTNNFVPCGTQHRGGDGSDVSFVTRQQYVHSLSCPVPPISKSTRGYVPKVTLNAIGTSAKSQSV